MGGVARRATAILDVKRKHSDVPVLVLDTGNALRQSENLEDPSNRWVMDAFNALGVHAVNVNEPDLRRFERLKGLGRIPPELKTDYLVSGLDASSSLQFPAKRYSVFTVRAASGGGEVRIGVLGVSSPSATPGAIPFQPPAEALKRVLPEIQGRVDLIVLLTRLQDQEIAALAQAFPSVGVIINGSAAGDGREFPRVGNAVAVESSHSGIGLGILELEWDSAGRVTSSKNLMMLLPPTIPEATALLEIVDKSRRDSAAFQEQEARKSAPVTQPSIFATAEACKTCHEKAFNVWRNSRHAQAIETLVRSGTQFNKECLNCHVTGFGLDRGFVNLLRTPKLAGVQCEACHGASVDHAGSPQDAHPGVGILRRMRRTVRKEFCLRCHRPENSPNFDYDRYWPQIAH